MTNWNSRFATGHAQIDSEHREFLLKLSSLRQAIDAGAGRERIVELILTLQKYVLGHFAREEAIMHRFKCRAAEENKTAHREFITKLEGWLVLLSSSGSSITLLSDVHREAFTWIENHILNCDCQLRNCPVPAPHDPPTHLPHPQI